MDHSCRVPLLMTSILGFELETVFENSWEVQMGYSFIIALPDPCLLPFFAASSLSSFATILPSSTPPSINLSTSTRHGLNRLVRAEEAMNGLWLKAKATIAYHSYRRPRGLHEGVKVPLYVHSGSTLCWRCRVILVCC